MRVVGFGCLLLLQSGPGIAFAVVDMVAAAAADPRLARGRDEEVTENFRAGGIGNTVEERGAEVVRGGQGSRQLDPANQEVGDGVLEQGDVVLVGEGPEGEECDEVEEECFFVFGSSFVGFVGGQECAVLKVCVGKRKDGRFNVL